MSTRDKLRKVLVDLELVSENDTIVFCRCYPGWWQRAAGAWSWYAQSENREICGSQFSMKQIVKFHAGKNEYKVGLYYPTFGTCPELIPEKIEHCDIMLDLFS